MQCEYRPIQKLHQSDVNQASGHTVHIKIERGIKVKSTNELKQRTTNEYFGKVFSELYQEWKSKTPDSNQQKFAELCHLGSKNSVSNYARGKSIPTDASVDEIIRVFNEAGMDVTREDFVPHTDDDTYRYDPSRVKDMQNRNRDIAKNIGLSEDFLNFVFDHTDFDDPDEGYPVWSPIASIPTNVMKRFHTDVKELKYLDGVFGICEFTRVPLKTTEAVTDDQKYTVKMSDGSSFVITEIDLHILKDLQDSIVDVIKYFYFKRKKAMKEQVIEVTKRHYSVERNKEKHTYTVSHHALSKEDYIAIDPYYQYMTFVDENGKEV